MIRNLTLSATGVMFVALAGSVTITSPAHAVVYCKTVGVPQGCVARRAPVARAVARPGVPMNRGGPVNRVGRR